MSGYSTYSVHTDHSIEARSWIVSRTPPPLHHEQDIVWASKRILDDASHEIVERVSMRHGAAYCEVHTPVRGWYLLITSPSEAFRSAQKQASSIHPHRSSCQASGQSRPYISLVPSRTSTHAGGSTEFKFCLVHVPNANVDKNKERKRKSYTVVQTDNDGANANVPVGASVNTGLSDKDWTTFPNSKPVHDNAFPNPLKHTLQSSIAEPEDPSLTSSTFTLRPISHSIATAHLASYQGSSDNASSFAAFPQQAKHHDHHARDKRRISLRGLAGLFSATDNSFELLWQNEETGMETPILLFEDHPSMLRTETRGQFHLLESTILSEFQLPPSSSSSSDREEPPQGSITDTDVSGRDADFDPMTFFVCVGIAYLGFLEDQEAYKAASHG